MSSGPVEEFGRISAGKKEATTALTRMDAGTSMRARFCRQPPRGRSRSGRPLPMSRLESRCDLLFGGSPLESAPALHAGRNKDVGASVAARRVAEQRASQKPHRAVRLRPWTRAVPHERPAVVAD